MSNSDIKLIRRRAILRQLEAASPARLSFDIIQAGLECAGLACSQNEIRAEMDYLQEKGMVKISRSQISVAHLRASLTARGRDYLESGEY